ncbi:MAG: heavy metal-binding domain-containing protein, partial [Pirellulales bacterium]
MAIDPICGMTVDERTAISAERDGETFYFCSEHCRRRFLAGEEGQPHGEHHAPDLVTFAAPPPPAPTGKIIYTCPMHPEIEQDRPGFCPKCGMALEPKTATAEADESEVAAAP